MTTERYNNLQFGSDDPKITFELTEEEIKEDWRFCNEYDGLLTNIYYEHCKECGRGCK